MLARARLADRGGYAAAGPAFASGLTPADLRIGARW